MCLKPSKRSILPLILLLSFCSVLAPGTAFPAAQTSRSSVDAPFPGLTPGKLFQQVSPSVVVVEALGADGKVLAQGSGVVVAQEEVVTNRHVIEGAKTVQVRQGGRTWSASPSHVNAEHDLAQIRAPGLDLPAVPIRSSTTLQTGERVFAVGAPQGLELTLSEGLISALRSFEGVYLVQTTAPVSAGSSGGGLFDAQGRLIGITTFNFKEGQNLNFALPGEWITTLPSYPAESSMDQRRAQVPDLPRWLMQGFDAIFAEDWTKAIVAFGEVVRLKPEFAEGWYCLGLAYARQGQIAQALPAFREAVRLKPDNAEAWTGLGAAYGFQGQLTEAIRALREAIHLKPDNAEAWYNLGVVYDNQGQHVEAISAYEEAIHLKLDYMEAWNNLGLAYTDQGQNTRAIAALREAIRLKSDCAECWFNLGRAYDKQGQHVEALSAFREAVRLKPDDPKSWYALGGLYSIQRDRARLMEVYRQLKILDPAWADKFSRDFVLP